MTHDERVSKQLAMLITGMGFRGLANELVTAQGYIVFLLDTYSLWSPEGTFTFHDGETIERRQWEEGQ